MGEIQEFRQITLEGWLSWKEDIREKLRETAGNFVYIGFRLKQIRDSGMLDGAADIFEFARKEYGLGKSTVSRFIAINEKFSEGGNSLELRKEFKAIGSSKLAEMLTLTDAECQLITEKTTVKEIRELKSFSRQQAPEDAIGQQVPEDATGQQVPEDSTDQHAPEVDSRQQEQECSRGVEPLTPLQKCLADFFRSKKELLNVVIPAVCEARYKDAAELMNPSGHCTHKKGICFLFMEDYSTGVKAKILTEPVPRAMTWTELLTELQNIFADTIASGVKDIHSAYYEAGETAGSGSGTMAPKAEESPKKRNVEAPVATSQQEENVEADGTSGNSGNEENAGAPVLDVNKESTVGEGEAGPVEPEETHSPSKETPVKAEKKEPGTAAMEDPEKEPLPGQMEVMDYPELMPTAHYEEIPAEDSGAGAAGPAAGVEEAPAEDGGTDAAEPAAGVQGAPAEDGGTDTASPAAGVQDETDGGDNVLPEDKADREQQEKVIYPKEKSEEDLFMEVGMHMQCLQKYLSVWDKNQMPQRFLRGAYDAAISIAAALERVMDKRGEWDG